MSTHRQHVIPDRTGASRRFVAAAALVLCVGLVGCAAAQPPTATPTGDAIPMPRDGDLEAGTYVVTGFSVPFEVTVPDGWDMRDGFFLSGDGVFLMFTSPTLVPADACEWWGTLTEVDPSVAGFTDAMVAAASTTTTAPIDVTSGGFDGVEFDLAVESDVSIDECDQSHVCIHSGWSGSPCSRYYQAVSQRETYRVFDLHGDRAVIAVGVDNEGAEPAAIDEARAVFDSIVFVSDE